MSSHPGQVKIDLGCGPAKRPGYIGVDVYPFPGVDVVYDGRTLPFESDSVDCVFSDQCFEHIHDIFGTMRELFRVCKHGAVVTIIVPHFSSCKNCYDLEHVRQFGYRTFDRVWGTDPTKTLSPHAVDGNFINRGVEFEWWQRRALDRKSWLWKAVIVPLSGALSLLANMSPFFCDRIWCRWVGGFDNIQYTLEVRKNAAL